MNRNDTLPERPRRRWLVPALVGGGVLLAAVLALTQPWLLWVDEVAQEELPTVAAAPPDPQTAEVDDDGAASDSGTGDSRVEEDAPSPESSPEPSAEPTAEATGPVELASGSFISRDHETTGRVAIVRLEDGSRILTIEDLQTDNGPDLYVYLDDDAADAPEGDFDDGIDLGRLRGNVGDLVYEIPDDVDLDAVTSVAIWCDRFSSLFGAADLTR